MLMKEMYLDGTVEQIKSLKALSVSGKVHMINFLKFRNIEEHNLDGRKAYATYMKAAMPFIKKAKAQLIYNGDINLSIIGPPENGEWDRILIVEYPSIDEFLKMVTNPDYPSALRKNALEDSRLFLSVPQP